MAAISKDELNYLIYRYLNESGLLNSAMSLKFETGIDKKIDADKAPPSGLITVVQKGLQYIETEANLDDSEADDDGDSVPLQTFDLITKSVPELQQMVKDKKKELCQKKLSEVKDKEKDNKKVESKRSVRRGIKIKWRSGNPKSYKDTEVVEIPDKKKEKNNETGSKKGKEQILDKDAAALNRHTKSGAAEIQHSEVTFLKGHTSQVFAGAWNPVRSLLASWSGDGTARIWKIPDGPCGKDVKVSLANVHVLKHQGGVSENSKNITSFDWNSDGSLLATGSFDGQTQIWNSDGSLRSSLLGHKGATISLKWNKKGDFLLTGSMDKSVIVWDTKTWELKQHFKFHKDSTLHVDWRNNDTFASGSSDGMVYVCKIGKNQPGRTFAGHQGDVNAVQWDPTGWLLASCSEDGTAKIWNLKKDQYLHDFKDHVKEICTLKWRPIGERSHDPDQLVLATASSDSTIKLWDVGQGRRLCSLDRHNQVVCAVDFSPNGEYLASGSLDQFVHIWSVKHERVIKTYKALAGAFDVLWNNRGDKLAACLANGDVCVMDFRM